MTKKADIGLVGLAVMARTSCSTWKAKVLL